MALDFNKFAAKGNKFMNELSKELGYPEDTARAGRVLKTVLHALRNQLPIEESVQLLTQLPMFLKAVYVENWSLREKYTKPRNITGFFNEIREIDKQTAQHDFPKDDDIDNALSVVFMMLRKHVTLGELEDIRAVLPKDLKYLVNQAIML